MQIEKLLFHQGKHPQHLHIRMQDFIFGFDINTFRLVIRPPKHL